MAQQRLAHKLLLAMALSLLVLAVTGAWLVVWPPAAPREPVRGGGARAGSGAGTIEAPPGESPPSLGAATHGLLPGAPAGDRTSVPATAGIEDAEAVSGVVLTLEGVPIAGARVEAARSATSRSVVAADSLRKEDKEDIVQATPARGAMRGSGHTDAAGRFDIGGLAGGHYDLEVTASGFGRRRVARAPSRKGTPREEPLRIVLHPELFLNGEVVERPSRPIAGAEVTLIFLAEDGSDLGAGDIEGGGDGKGEGPGEPAAAHAVRTDAGGRFRLGGLGRGVYRAEARAAGYMSGIAPLVEIRHPDGGGESRLVFELERGHLIRGVVWTEGGETLADARVRLRAAPAGRRIEAIAHRDREVPAVTTGADGSFELPGLPAKTYRLEVSASGHRGRVLDAAAGGEPLEIVLEPAAPLEGSVSDQASGDPVPDAEVRWLSGPGAWGGADPAPAAHTDAAGRFRIERLPGDGRGIRIDAEGYSTLEVGALDAPDGGWTIALERSGSVRGRVRAAGDLPVEGLSVSLVDVPAGADSSGPEERALLRPVARSATTDAAGSYRVPVPGAGSYRVVVDGHPYTAASSEVLTVPDDRAEVECADIFLSLEATVQGSVFSQALGGVPGALVMVIPESPPEESRPASVEPRPSGAGFNDRVASRADAAGAFTVGGLRAGAYRILARAPGFVTARSEAFHIAAGDSQAVEVELEPEMAITGRVAGPDGIPVPFAEIRAIPGGEGAAEPWSEESSVSTTAGKFRLSRLGGRSYDLRFSAEGFAPALLPGVAAGSANVDVRLERLVPLSGRVLGAHTGEPVAEFKLRLRFEEEDLLPAREKASRHGWRSFSDPAGAFRIDDLPPGRYLVEASAAGHLGADDLEIDVPIQGRENAEVRLVEAGLVMGVVIDGHLNAIAGARVEALQRYVDPDRGTVSFRPIILSSPRSEAAAREPGEGGGERRRRGREGDRSPSAVRTGDDGGFVLRGLPDGVYRFRIAHDDHLSRELGDHVFENGLCEHEPLTLEILLPSGVTLVGRVRRGRGVEPGAISVVLRPVTPDQDSWAWRAARSKFAEVDGSGHFEIRGLEVGNYVLHARFRRADGSYESIRRDVRIHGAGREQGILLDFSR